MSKCGWLYQAYTGIVQLLYPDLCAGCGEELLTKNQFLCLDCLHNLPVTNFHLHEGNPVEKVFFGRLPITAATAYLYFSKQSAVQHLLHRLKYKDEPEIGSYFGKRMGEALKGARAFMDVEGLIPLPLFYKKQKKRGYNQAAVICEGISSVLNIPVLEKVIERTKSTETQASKARADRWKNVEGKFQLRHADQLVGKHVLLVDDVLTTGATLEACGRELIGIKDLRLSIAVLAYVSL